MHSIVSSDTNIIVLFCLNSLLSVVWYILQAEQTDLYQKTTGIKYLCGNTRQINLSKHDS